MSLVLTESLRLQIQDVLAGDLRHVIVGFLKRESATLVSKAWRSARYQQTTRVSCRDGITDAVVPALAKSCPNLTTIDLTYCINITDAAILALAKGCPNLTTIRLDGCANITDAAILALAKGCPNLTTIDLGGCTNITDAAILALAKGCPNLTYMGLGGCTNITAKAKAALRESHEGINIRS